MSTLSDLYEEYKKKDYRYAPDDIQKFASGSKNNQDVVIRSILEYQDGSADTAWVHNNYNTMIKKLQSEKEVSLKDLGTGYITTLPWAVEKAGSLVNPSINSQRILDALHMNRISEKKLDKSSSASFKGDLPYLNKLYDIKKIRVDLFPRESSYYTPDVLNKANALINDTINDPRNANASSSRLDTSVRGRLHEEFKGSDPTLYDIYAKYKSNK